MREERGLVSKDRDGEGKRWSGEEEEPGREGVDNEGEGSEPEKIHETRSLGQGYSHEQGRERVMERSTN